MDDYNDIIGIDVAVYDEREVHTGCTVEILRNSVTGDVSIGWWEEDDYGELC